MKQHFIASTALLFFMAAPGLAEPRHNNSFASQGSDRGANSNSGNQSGNNQISNQNQNSGQSVGMTGGQGQGQGGAPAPAPAATYKSTLDKYPIAKVDASGVIKEMVQGTKDLATTLAKGTTDLFSTIKDLNASIKDVDLSKMQTSLDGTYWNNLEKANSEKANAETTAQLATMASTALTAIKTVYAFNPSAGGLTPHGNSKEELAAESNSKKIIGVEKSLASTTTSSTNAAAFSASTDVASRVATGSKTPSLVTAPRAFTGGYNPPTKGSGLGL